MNNVFLKFVAAPALGLTMALTWGCSNEGQTSAEKTIAPANVTLDVKRGTSDEGTPTLVATHIVTSQVRVDAIDYDTRNIVLTGPEGHQEAFVVGPEVVNFDQIHKGDMVNAKFTEKLAISVQEASDTTSHAEVATIQIPPEGSKPGIVATRTGEITATVTAIDQDTRVVSVIGPRGNTLTFQVAPEAKGLDNVHVGDQVIAHYAEAVEITVTGS